MFLFLVSEKGTEKADLGGLPPKYPRGCACYRRWLRVFAYGKARHAPSKRTRGESYQSLCFRRLEVRTAKSEKLTQVGSENFSDLFSENSQRFKPRFARIWNLGMPSPLGSGAARGS